MLFAASALKGYAIEASDGRIGSVTDFLLEDDTWKIRWLVDDTGGWLLERKVLIPPSAILQTDFENRVLRVRLTKTQVESSPDISQDEPISRQMEHTLYSYYGWEPYWGADITGFATPLQPMPYLASAAMAAAELPIKSGDPHLRSVAEMSGYHISATDGEIGHLENFR